MTDGAQLDLFDGPHTRQGVELERVGGAIGDSVLAFCRARVGQEFRMEQLREHVERDGHRAPDSAGRILRMLRQRGRVAYTVVNRSASLYRIDACA